MLKRLIPFFKSDEADGWGSVFSQTDESANDDQPENPESDAEDLEEDPAEEQDEVEPDSDADNEEAAEEETEEPPAFNDDTEVDLGEGRQPVKLAELKQGYLRQSDYTKKTQELATQRKDVESQLEQAKPAQEWLSYMNQNPWLFQQFHQAIQQWNQTGVLPLEDVMQDPESAKYINHFMAENDALKKENETLKAKYGDLEFGTGMDKTIAELHAEYGDLITPEYEQVLRDQAKTENLKPDMLKRLAKGDLAEKKMQSSKKTAGEIEAETIQQLQEKRKSLPPNPKSKGQKPQSPTKSVEDMSWAELLQG